MTDYTCIRTEVHGRVATITLDRPKALNALSPTLVRELFDAASRFDEDPAIGAIVLTGSERAFAAGADIRELAELDYAGAYLDNPFPAWSTFERLRTPIVAAVAGFALGGGCELAMMCDIILAADTAEFGLPELSLGIIPGFGGTQRLPRAVGKYKAAEMILTGRRIKADEAERSGLASRVVPADELLAEAARVAETIAARSLPAVYAAKDALQASQEQPLSEGLRFERQAFAAMFATEDHVEGLTAFTEKRAPEFKHR